MMTIIRDAEPTDFRALATLWREAGVCHPEIDPIYGQIFSGIWDYRTYLGLLDRGRHWRILVAEQAGTIIGYAVASAASTRFFYQIVRVPYGPDGSVESIRTSSRLFSQSRTWLEERGVGTTSLRCLLEARSPNYFAGSWGETVCSGLVRRAQDKMRQVPGLRAVA